MGDHNWQTCNFCSKPAALRCSMCRQIFYCSKEHQKQDWGSHKKACVKVNYKIEKDPKLGRCLILNEDTNADQIILKEKPLVLGPKNSSKGDFCFGCFKELGFEGVNYEGESCESCTLPICSRECSKEKSMHKNLECRLFRESGIVQNKEEEIDHNFLGKIWRNLFYIRCLLIKFFEPKTWQDFNALQTNNEYRGDLTNLEQTTRIFDEIKFILLRLNHPNITSFSKPDLHNALGIIETNAVEIRISSTVEIMALYKTFSMVQHSCIPNCKFYFYPNKNVNFLIFLRTAVNIKAGEQTSIMYSNILWNTQKRREHMKKTKYFFCECKRCMDPTELSSHFSTILCPLPNCRSFSVPEGLENAENPHHWKCAKCNKICESYQVKKVDTKLNETMGRLDPSFNNYQNILNKFEEIVHPDYYINFVLNHSLLQLYGQSPETRTKSLLEEKINLGNRLLGILKKIDPGLSVTSIYAAVIYYEMHSAILALAGGEVDDDFNILRINPDKVKLAKTYLQKTIDCFQYEFIDVPEGKLKILAQKKINYLNLIISNKR